MGESARQGQDETRRLSGRQPSRRHYGELEGRQRTAPGAHRMAPGGDLQRGAWQGRVRLSAQRSEEHTSELQSLMRISYAVCCLKKKNRERTQTRTLSR